jgi:hypothetical protein
LRDLEVGTNQSCKHAKDKKQDGGINNRAHELLFSHFCNLGSEKCNAPLYTGHRRIDLNLLGKSLIRNLWSNLFIDFGE